MSAKYKLFIVAGEASGDTHAAHLIREARGVMPDMRIEGLGGEKMRLAGCELRADLVSMAVMGFIKVIANIRFFHRLMRETIEHIEKSRPNAVVLVDYPGFNLRLAAKVKKLDIPVIYYISPQIWAWKPGRIKQIKKTVDKMIVILPFEEQIYLDAGVDATYVGHPLIDSISASKDAPDTDFVANLHAPDPSAIIGLLPGSRKQEITDFLPVLIETARLILESMPNATFLIPCSGAGNMETVKEIVGESSIPLRIFLGKIHETAEASRCCIVASGTATLEVACFSTPLIVVYRTGRVPWLLSRVFLRVDYVSLVNIIAGEEVVPEMLQSLMRPEPLAETTIELCRDGEKREAMIEKLKKALALLGGPGASKRAADIVCETIVSAGKARKSLAAT